MMDDVIEVEQDFDHLIIKLRIKNNEQLRELYWRFYMHFPYVYRDRGFATSNMKYDEEFGMLVYMKLEEMLKKMKINPMMERKE